MTMKQSLTIHPKVSAAAVAAQLALIGVWVVQHWVDVPPEIVGYIVAIASAVGGWLAPAQAASAPK